VAKLNEIVKIADLEAFSMKMFDAKSDVKDLSTEEIIKLDYKEFEFGGEKYGIGVMETTNKDFGLERKEEIAEKLAEMKKRDNLKAIFLSVIDILKQESWTICSGEEERDLFKKMFKAEEKDGVLFVPNLVSRKKEIVPVFEKFLSK
jgi:manganese-dependent inorganic pyrophosphatase